MSIRTLPILLLATCLAPLNAQTTTLIPVSCAHPKDAALPSTAAANLTTQQADAKDRVSRQQPGVIAMDEPRNLELERREVAAYADCLDPAHCYWSDLAGQTKRAVTELDRVLAEHHATTPEAAQAQKLAIVLDIDETSLSSYCEEKREDYGFIASMFDAWVVSPEASIPIPGTLELYNHATKAGVVVVFITGRPGKGMRNDQTEGTAANLAAAGFHGWKDLILHDATYPTKDTTEYKSQARQRLVERGYKIVLNMGDQWSDLNGEPRGEVSVKLPNPFYYLQ